MGNSIKQKLKDEVLGGSEEKISKLEAEGHFYAELWS